LQLDSFMNKILSPVLADLAVKIYSYAEVSDALSTCFTIFGCNVFPA